MNWFSQGKKEKEAGVIDKDKNDSKDIIELSSVQLSYIISGLILTAFFIFISGYYWGKKTIVQDFNDQINNESLAHKVESALYFNSSYTDVLDKSESISSDIDRKADLDGNKEILQDNSIKSSNENVNSIKENKSQNDIAIDKVNNETQYAAHLAGFGTLKAAQKCIDSLTLHGYKVKLSERTSKNSSGETKTWYQVVTPWYDKKVLDNLLPGIKKVGRLKDVMIVSKKN